MNKKIEKLIKDEVNLPASVFHCDVLDLKNEIESMPNIKLVIAKDYYTYHYYINTLGKPISRLLK